MKKVNVTIEGNIIKYKDRSIDFVYDYFVIIGLFGYRFFSLEEVIEYIDNNELQP